MRNTALILSLILLHSCTYPSEMRKAKNKCKGAVKFIEKNWKYDRENDIYVVTDKFLEKYQHYDIYFHCLHGLSRENIQLLLGEPNEAFPKKLYYYYEKDCHESGSECKGMKVNLRDNRVLGFYQGIIRDGEKYY